MLFGSDHYVPVLKIKRAEKAALAIIGGSHEDATTPLLEVVKRTDKSLSDHLDTTFEKLALSLTKTAGCFLDAKELAPDGDPGADKVFSRATSEGIEYVPVVGLTRKAGNAPAIHHGEGSVALRLTREELEAGGITAAITQFMKANKSREEAVDLVMDMGDVGQMVSIGVSGLASKFLHAVPNHAAWRTFTISGCAFPKSMGGVGKHSFLLADRSEWVCWRDSLYKKRASLARLPTFSDCAIQHSEGVEDFDPVRMAASACARYAVNDWWLLVKGESTRKVRAGIQFPKIAKRVVNNVHGNHYQGIKHCAGCKSINDAANGAPKLGSPEAWRRLGTIHHVATVLKDLKVSDLALRCWRTSSAISSSESRSTARSQSTSRGFERSPSAAPMRSKSARV